MINYYRAALRYPSKIRSTITTPTLIVWGDQDGALKVKLLEGTDKYVSDLKVNNEVEKEKEEGKKKETTVQCKQTRNKAKTKKKLEIERTHMWLLWFLVLKRGELCPK